MLRVGHGANTLDAFEEALAHGVEMIEFDVRADRGRLVLAHSPLDLRLRRCLPLDRALDVLAAPRFAELRFNVDVKERGLEAATLYALERFGLTDRSLISSRIPEVLDRFRSLDPSVRVGVSVGGPLTRRRPPFGALLADVAARRFDALMVHHPLVDADLVTAARERAAEVFAWTPDDRAAIERLSRLDVGGVITNDPRLFAPRLAG